VVWDPEYVVVACVGEGDRGCAQAERDFAAMPGVAAIRAARTGNVIAVPSELLYSTGHSMLDVVELLGSRRRLRS
jgi:ABC-type hemin transport system substrate-binding protein